MNLKDKEYKLDKLNSCENNEEFVKIQEESKESKEINDSKESLDLSLSKNNISDIKSLSDLNNINQVPVSNFASALPSEEYNTSDEPDDIIESFLEEEFDSNSLNLPENIVKGCIFYIFDTRFSPPVKRRFYTLENFSQTVSIKEQKKQIKYSYSPPIDVWKEVPNKILKTDKDHNEDHDLYHDLQEIFVSKNFIDMSNEELKENFSSFKKESNLERIEEIKGYLVSAKDMLEKQNDFVGQFEESKSSKRKILNSHQRKIKTIIKQIEFCDKHIDQITIDNNRLSWDDIDFILNKTESNSSQFHNFTTLQLLK